MGLLYDACSLTNTSISPEDIDEKIFECLLKAGINRDSKPDDIVRKQQSRIFPESKAQSDDRHRLSIDCLIK